jgi:hypothetical protein
VGISYPPEHAARLRSSQKSLFLDSGCVGKSDYVNELFGSCVLASSKAFKKEAIAACHNPKGKGNHQNILDVDVDVDDNETQLLSKDLHPHGLVCPQYFAEVEIISQSSRLESRFGPVSASKAQFRTMILPLNGMHLKTWGTSLEWIWLRPKNIPRRDRGCQRGSFWPC